MTALRLGTWESHRKSHAKSQENKKRSKKQATESYFHKIDLPDMVHGTAGLHFDVGL